MMVLDDYSTEWYLETLEYDLQIRLETYRHTDLNVMGSRVTQRLAGYARRRYGPNRSWVEIGFSPLAGCSYRSGFVEHNETLRLHVRTFGRGILAGLTVRPAFGIRF